MKLRASATLSLKKRGLLVHRVVEEEWSLAEAGIVPWWQWQARGG